MFINRKTHYLSDVLFLSAGIHILANVLLLIARLLIRKGESSQPDMANHHIFVSQVVVSFLMLTALAFIYVSAWHRLKKNLSVVEESDRLSMAALQQEVLGKDIPSLSGGTINSLLELWGVILIGVRFVYDVCSVVYRRFILKLAVISSSDSVPGTDYVTIYNSTHGFKYISMLTALLLGLCITGIFLKDRLLKMIALILISFFLLSFVLLGMQTVNIAGYSIGIVWSSIIFHFTETIGLAALGYYLKHGYIGL